MKPIFCIGEVLEEREANKQNEVVAAQLASVFSLSAEDFSKIILAYEPVWAIGTGKTATAEQAQEIHAFIRSLIATSMVKKLLIILQSFMVEAASLLMLKNCLLTLT